MASPHEVDPNSAGPQVDPELLARQEAISLGQELIVMSQMNPDLKMSGGWKMLPLDPNENGPRLGAAFEKGRGFDRFRLEIEPSGAGISATVSLFTTDPRRGMNKNTYYLSVQENDESCFGVIKPVTAAPEDPMLSWSDIEQGVSYERILITDYGSKGLISDLKNIKDKIKQPVAQPSRISRLLGRKAVAS